MNFHTTSLGARILSHEALSSSVIVPLITEIYPVGDTACNPDPPPQEGLLLIRQDILLTRPEVAVLRRVLEVWLETGRLPEGALEL